MKSTKIKIILSAVTLLSVIGFVGTVNAAGPSLYVSPASLTKTAGNTFSVSAGLNASGSKVCAVEGTLVFNNLSCQSITVASDVMAQSSPTCSNPHFLIGIPNCTTLDKVLLTVSVKARSAGTASISYAGVDIIGKGVSLGSSAISGNYTIKAVPKAVTAPKKVVAPPVVVTPVVVTPETVAPVTESAAPLKTVPAEANVAQIPPGSLLLAQISRVITLGSGNNLIGFLFLSLYFLSLFLIAIPVGIQRARRKDFWKLQ